MKPRLIVTSHGRLAEEILKSASMIAGDTSDIFYVNMESEDGLEGTTLKMKKVIEECDDQPVLIVADLFGGTPFNVASMIATNRKNTRVVSGLNLGMIIEYTVSSIEDVNELCDYLLTVGKQGVMTVNIEEDDDIDIG